MEGQSGKSIRCDHIDCMCVSDLDALVGKARHRAQCSRESGADHRCQFWTWRRYAFSAICAFYDVWISSALARVFYTVGAKVILASRDTQQLERLKFQLDSEPDGKVRNNVKK